MKPVILHNVLAAIFCYKAMKIDQISFKLADI